MSAAFHLYPTVKDTIGTQSLTDKVVVLDLDSTLIHTQDTMQSLKKINLMNDPTLGHLKRRCYVLKFIDKDEDGKTSRGDLWGITRPHIEEFLLFCFSYFRVVIVWSAGDENYVHEVVNHLFKNLRQPHLILTKKHIDMDGDDIIKS